MVWPCPLDRFMPLPSVNFWNFATRMYLSVSLPPLLAGEQMLMRFCTHLVDRLHHSSIKVYLSAVRSLHIDYGFSDPLPNCLQLHNCLQLQRLLCGIKRHQDSNLTQRQPVTADLMSVLHRSLDLANPDNVMLWAACCVGFFGFLRGGEFTVNSSFDPSLHLTLDDMQVDAPLNPQKCLRVYQVLQDRPFPKGLLRLSWSWFRPSMPCGFLGKLPSPSWTGPWTSTYLSGWHSSF